MPSRSIKNVRAPDQRSFCICDILFVGLIEVYMPRGQNPYDEEILLRVWKTQDGAVWVWRMVAAGKRVAIVRWKWKWLKWFRIICIIRPDDGGSSEIPDPPQPTEKRKRPVLVA